MSDYDYSDEWEDYPLLPDEEEEYDEQAQYFDVRITI